MITRISISFALLVSLIGASAFAQAPGPGRGAAPPPATPNAPAPGPTYAEAQKVLAAAWASAHKINVKLSCAVVDSRGDLVARGRMDGARFQTPDVARGKALTSAMFGQPSGGMGALAN